MTIDALQLRRARLAIFGPPTFAIAGLALVVSGTLGLAIQRRTWARPPGAVSATVDRGFVVVSADGRIYSDTDPTALVPSGIQGARVVGMTRAFAGGLWVAASDGRVFAANAASPRSIRLRRHEAPIVGIAAARHGGYWLVSSDGHIYSVGAPAFARTVKVSTPVVGIARSPSGGFWVATRDGRVIPIHAPQMGDLRNARVKARVVGIAAAPGGGYWLAAADGRVLGFSAPSFGAMRAARSDPVVAIAAPITGGYWLTTESGAVHAFGNAKAPGTFADAQIDAPVVAIAPK